MYRNCNPKTQTMCPKNKGHKENENIEFEKYLKLRNGKIFRKIENNQGKHFQKVVFLIIKY